MHGDGSAEGERAIPREGAVADVEGFGALDSHGPARAVGRVVARDRVHGVDLHGALSDKEGTAVEPCSVVDQVGRAEVQRDFIAPDCTPIGVGCSVARELRVGHCEGRVGQVQGPSRRRTIVLESALFDLDVRVEGRADRTTVDGFVAAEHHIPEERIAAVDLHRSPEEGACAAAVGDDGVANLKRHGIQGDAGVPCPLEREAGDDGGAGLARGGIQGDRAVARDDGGRRPLHGLQCNDFSAEVDGLRVGPRGYANDIPIAGGGNGLADGQIGALVAADIQGRSRSSGYGDEGQKHGRSVTVQWRLGRMLWLVRDQSAPCSAGPFTTE